MYIPKINQENDLDTLQQFMKSHNFAIMVSHHEGEMTATHLPLLLDTSRGEYGTIRGHIARANKQWKAFESSEVLVIYNGPHAYVSPSWYEDHPSVPTWNYATVHAYGQPQIIDEPDAVVESLRALVNHHEQGRNPAWQMDLPQDFMDKMVKAIVAIEIPITRLEGKFKLSQNKSESDKQNVIAHLLESHYPEEVATAKLMQAQEAVSE